MGVTFVVFVLFQKQTEQVPQGIQVLSAVQSQVNVFFSSLNDEFLKWNLDGFGLKYSPRLGLPRLHVYTAPFRVSAINVYKIDLPFTRTLACDQRCRN